MALPDGKQAMSRLLSFLMTVLRLHRVEVDREEGVVRKKRTRMGVVIVWAGNGYARLAKERVRVLTIPRWHHREAMIYEHLYQSPLQTLSNGTLVMKWMGISVKGLLTSQERGPLFRLDLAREVSRSLSELHGMQFDGHAVSHADASMTNVVYDESNGKTAWIDFELVHTPALSTEERHADDLRAMMFTYLSFLPEPERPKAVHAMIQAYSPQPALLQAFSNQIRDPKLRRDAYHRAQVRLSDSDHQKITGLLVKEIGTFAG